MKGDPPTLVCFDWGGVILRICQSLDEACERVGLERRAIADPSAFRASQPAIVRAYESGRISCEEYFRGLSDAAGGVYSPEEFGAIHDAWLIEEYPGADTLVDDLLALGVRTAMLSNTNHRHWIRCGETDHGPAFPTKARLDHPHASHLLGHAKPTREIFARFEEETGFSADQTVFFDDRADNVSAARAAGWRAEQIDHAGDPPAQVRRILTSLGVFGA